MKKPKKNYFQNILSIKISLQMEIKFKKRTLGLWARISPPVREAILTAILTAQSETVT